MFRTRERNPRHRRRPLWAIGVSVLVGVSVVPAPVLRADEAPTRLTLADAMARARSGAHVVHAAEARTQASEARLREAEGHRLPTVKVEEVWMLTDSPADVFGLQLNQERFSFPDFVASDPNHPDFFDNALSRVEVSVPLYTGGELATRIHQARLGAESADRHQDWSTGEAALAAARAYLQLAQAREGVALLERSLETVRAHADRARAYEAQGMLVASERLRAEVEVARVEDLLTDARGRARVAEAALSLRLGADPGSRWELDPLPDPPPLTGDLDTWLSGVDRRADLDAARRQVRAAELEAQAALAARKPRLGVALRQDFYDDWPLGGHGSDTSVIVQGSVELFSGGRHKAAASRARSEAEAAAIDLARFTDGAALQIRDAWESATAARERHATARTALEAAREAERITGERFDKGVARMIDLLDTLTARREAEMRELVARTDAHLATVTLYQQAGLGPEAALAGHVDTDRTEDPQETPRSTP